MSSPPKKQKYSHYKAKNYSNSHKKLYLEAGQRGFLATCNFREKDCVRESYNILNEYADELYGSEKAETAPAPAVEEAVAVSDATKDIADDLQNEITASKKSIQGVKQSPTQTRRFQVVDTGTTNCVFIRTTLPDPVQLGERIVRDIASSRIQKSRFLLRLIPIEAVCRANLADIASAGGALFDKHFLKQPTTFSIVFNKRYNNDIKRDDVIRELAELVQEKNVGNSVDLKQAAKTVVVEVIKGLCCLGVVTGYLQYKKYNILELANTKDDPAANGEKEDVSPTEIKANENTDEKKEEKKEIEDAEGGE